ncbi:MAG: PQQ-binding-like beta-propeller repeat protein, partial [Lentisphaerae bacterium]|nr:PQQ-binding-like beta-propeller repeat protein [Lentisphaerota bacterium]
TFTLPGQAKNRAPNWGYIGIYKDLLIAGSEPLAITMTKESKVPSVVKDAPYSSSSKHLVVMNRYSGKILWQREAQQVFRHNAIAAANNMIYCIDGLSAASLSLMRRRGEEPDSPSLLLALDAHTGKLCWSHEDKIFGTWLGYSEEFNILIESGSPARDRARDEAEGQMAAYNATTGEIIWHENFKYNGRPMLRGDTIYTEGTAFSLVAGKPKKRLNPVTGRATTWAYKRNYGCNTPIGGQHMLLFRSAAAGFYDLSTDGGTGNWGGFKSGCTANLIPADGILSAPDYTRTCTCSYQNQCSLGLIPMNDVELWTFQEFKKITGPIQNIAINFGAPGDWPAPDGNLWFEYPVVGGDGPDLGLTTTGKPQYFRRHSLELQGTHQQVAASGIIGETTITIPLGSKVDRIYDVQLIFADPVADKPGQRLFDVTLQNKVVLPKLDVVAASGGHKKSLIHDFTRVIAGEKITIELKQAEGSSLPPLLCGIAISRRDPVHFDFILNTDAASSPRADALGGQISVSNCYPQPLQGNFTVTLADNVVISRELNLDNLTETTINIDVPANYINTSEQLAVTYDIGPDFGKFRHLSDSFALSAPIPLDIRFTAASVDTINIEARGIDPNLTQHPELTLLLNNEEIHKTTLEIPPMTSTSIPCQLPLKLYDTKATLTAKVKWPATETPLSGEFSDTFSFVTLPTRPVGAPPSAKPSITLDRKSGVFPEGVRKKVADTDDNTATIDWWSDGEALEIRAWVTDDHHFNTKEKDGIWNGDALQMCFAAFDGSYVNIALALTTKGKVLWCYDGDAEKIYQHAVTSVVRNDAIMETAYSLRIPLDILGIDSKPGSILRANFVVFDDDNGNGFKYWRQLTPGLAGGFNLNEYHIFAIGEP